MALSKRRELTNYLITQLKQINGAVSPLDSSYTFSTNLFNNVVRGFQNIENINDFPYMTVEAGPERYTYQTIGNTEGSLEILLRCYLRNGERPILNTDVDNLIQDIDHVIYKMSTQVNDLHTVHLLSVDSDQGLLEDYAIIEIRLVLEYELGNI